MTHGNTATPTATFSELSKHPRHVIDRVERNLRVHITRRDGEDLFLSTISFEQQRQHTETIALRLLRALLRNPSPAAVTTLHEALPEVFGWLRHLSDGEKQQFARQLADALADATELDVYANLDRVISEWAATARILADPALTAQLTAPLPDLPENGFGEVPEP